MCLAGVGNRVAQPNDANLLIFLERRFQYLYHCFCFSRARVRCQSYHGASSITNVDYASKRFRIDVLLYVDTIEVYWKCIAPREFSEGRIFWETVVAKLRVERFVAIVFDYVVRIYLCLTTASRQRTVVGVEVLLYDYIDVPLPEEEATSLPSDLVKLNFIYLVVVTNEFSDLLEASAADSHWDNTWFEILHRING